MSFPSGRRISTTASAAEKYLNQDWKDNDGKVLRTTKLARLGGVLKTPIGATPFANDYELDFARELITYEKLGQGATTDLSDCQPFR